MHKNLHKTELQKIQGEIWRKIVIVDTNITLSKTGQVDKYVSL